MISEGGEAGRIKDTEDGPFRDTCCNQIGGDCSKYQDQRPLVPVGRAGTTRRKF